MSFIHDHSGSVFKTGTKKKKLTIKDMKSNCEAAWLRQISSLVRQYPANSAQVIAATLIASHGQGYYSKVLLADAILEFYDTNRLLPDGLTKTIPAVTDWAAKMGMGLSRLVAGNIYIYIYIYIQVFFGGLFFGGVVVLGRSCGCCFLKIFLRLVATDDWRCEARLPRHRIFNGFEMKRVTTWSLGSIKYIGIFGYFFCFRGIFVSKQKYMAPRIGQRWRKNGRMIGKTEKTGKIGKTHRPVPHPKSSRILTMTCCCRSSRL